MKNLWNLVTLTWDRILRMTLKQQLILIGSIILPAGSLILIFSQLGRLITRKLVKAKTSKTSGSMEGLVDKAWVCKCGALNSATLKTCGNCKE